MKRCPICFVLVCLVLQRAMRTEQYSHRISSILLSTCIWFWRWKIIKEFHHSAYMSKIFEWLKTARKKWRNFPQGIVSLFLGHLSVVVFYILLDYAAAHALVIVHWVTENLQELQQNKIMIYKIVGHALQKQFLKYFD